MTIADWVTTGMLSGSERRRTALLFVAAIALHLIILGPLALRWFASDLDMSFEAPPLVLLDIEPRPMLKGETTRRATASPPALARPAQTANRAPSTLRLKTDEEDDAPSSPTPHVAAAAGSLSRSAGNGIDEAWTYRPETLSAAVGRTLRTSPVGCPFESRLTAAERALCEERFNAAAGAAAPLGPRTLDASEARRQAQLERDGARALADYEEKRRPLSGGVGVAGISPDCPGGNLRGTCAGANLPSQYQYTDGDPARDRTVH